MNPEDVVEAGCYLIAAVAALALLLLANRRSFLSRYVDRQADDTTVGGPR